MTIQDIVFWAVILGIIFYAYIILKSRFSEIKERFNKLIYRGEIKKINNNELSSEIKMLQDKINNQRKINQLQEELDRLKRKNE